MAAAIVIAFNMTVEWSTIMNIGMLCMSVVPNISHTFDSISLKNKDMLDAEWLLFKLNPTGNGCAIWMPH